MITVQALVYLQEELEQLFPQGPTIYLPVGWKSSMQVISKNKNHFHEVGATTFPGQLIVGGRLWVEKESDFGDQLSGPGCDFQNPTFPWAGLQ